MTARSRSLAAIALPLLLLASPCGAEEASSASRAAHVVLADIGNLYVDRPSLLRLGLGIAGDAVFANTNADRFLRNRYQDKLRSRDTDRVARVAKVPGTAVVTVPVYAATYGVSLVLHNATAEAWAQRSFRATLVGAPALLVLQEAIGSDRPQDGDSHWRPFRSSHGVSGHAFIGSVPLVTAAKMADDPYWKAGLYGLSTLTALSRINDDDHYFSQAALGWYLAYVSCDAVLKTDRGRAAPAGLSILPVRAGLAVAFRREF